MEKYDVKVVQATESRQQIKLFEKIREVIR